MLPRHQSLLGLLAQPVVRSPPMRNHVFMLRDQFRVGSSMSNCPST